MGEEGREGGEERREEDGGGRRGREDEGGRVGWGRGGGGARGRRHPCLSPSPALPLDVQPTGATLRVSLDERGDPSGPSDALSPRGSCSVVSLAAAVCPACSCSPPALPSLLSPPRPPPPSGGFCSRPPPGPGGDPPTCLLKIPRGPERGGAALGGAFPTVPVGVKSTFRQPLPACGVYLWAPDDPAGSRVGLQGLQGWREHWPLLLNAVLGQWRAGGAGGSSLVRVPLSSLFTTLCPS